MAHWLDRRQFLAAAAAASAGLVLAPQARTASAQQAGDRFRLAVLGHMYNAGHFFSSIHAYPQVELVALCNPDERKHQETYQTWKSQAQKLADSPRGEDRRAAERYAALADRPPPAYADFRRMFDEMGDRIDGLVVSLFDHYHGPACGTAMRLGKHVFSERPLGLTIREARLLRELASQTNVATSIRNPGNASPQFRRGIELVQDGVIGTVEEVHFWFDRVGADRQRRPEGMPPVPDGLHWDLWLGPAAERPYHPDWMAYSHWREFSNGGLGTFGPHAANLAFYALKIHELWSAADSSTAAATIRVQADCPSRNRLSFPKWETIRWQVPARGELPPVTFTWHHGAGLSPGAQERLGGLMADRGASPEKQRQLLGYAGALLVGSEGLLATDDHNVKFTLLPEDKFRDVAQDRPQRLPASRGHYHDWLHHARGGQPAFAHFGYAGVLSEFLMLGNLATQLDGELAYDPRAGRIVNQDEASADLGYDYRDGWTL